MLGSEISAIELRYVKLVRRLMPGDYASASTLARFKTDVSFFIIERDEPLRDYYFAIYGPGWG